VRCPAHVNGAQVHPTLPLLAVSTGARRFALPGEEPGGAGEDGTDGGKRKRGGPARGGAGEGGEDAAAEPLGPFDNALLLMRFPVEAAAASE